MKINFRYRSPLDWRVWPVLFLTALTIAAEDFKSADIGTPANTGSSTNIPAGTQVTTGGLDIGGAKDEGQFYYRSAAGDFDVRVCVESLDQSPRVEGFLP
jgi:hypothetical protein